MEYDHGTDTTADSVLVQSWQGQCQYGYWLMVEKASSMFVQRTVILRTSYELTQGDQIVLFCADRLAQILGTFL